MGLFDNAKAKVQYEAVNWKLASRELDRQRAVAKGASKADAAKRAIERTPPRGRRR